jgi:predicted ATPase
MRVALTGASCTGKTTLLNDLLETALFKERGIKPIQLDNRRILSGMDLRADGVGAERGRRREFQWKLLSEKKKLEINKFAYITDRSTVDMAAYWMVRDAEGAIDSEGEEYIAECKAFALQFDLHVHLPFGAIPFKADGQRPQDENFNKLTCETVLCFLDEWKLNYISLTQISLLARTNAVISSLLQAF